MPCARYKGEYEYNLHHVSGPRHCQEVGLSFNETFTSFLNRTSHAAFQIECARLARAEESKVFLSQDLVKGFSEALQDKSFNKINATAIIKQAMTGFVMGVTGTEMEFTRESDGIDSAIHTLYSYVENDLGLQEKEECCLDPVFEIDIEFSADEVLEEEVHSEAKTTTPAPEMEVYFDESDEPLFEVDIFADSDREPESEPENTITEVEDSNMPDAEPETDQNIDPMEDPNSEPETEPETCEGQECQSGEEDHVHNNDEQFDNNDKEKIVFEDDGTIDPVGEPEDHETIDPVGEPEDDETYTIVDLINDVIQIGNNLASDADLEEEFAIEQEADTVADVGVETMQETEPEVETISQNEPEAEMLSGVPTTAENKTENPKSISSTATTSAILSTTTTNTTPTTTQTTTTTTSTTTQTTTTGCLKKNGD